MLTAEPMFTAEQRKEVIWAKNAKMVRQGVYDVGIFIGALFLADKVAKSGLNTKWLPSVLP